MNKVINKLLIVRDKFIPEMHLIHIGFACSACGSLTKNHERIQKFKGPDSRYIHQSWTK